jgi:REP element-mobilizing transposase RayT
MPLSYSQLLVHAVFSIRQRLPLICPKWQGRLYGYLAGIATELRGHLLRGGGITDHVHLLLHLPASLAMSDAMRLLKTNSSKWVHETFPEAAAFAWQSGYGAFSVSMSMRATLIGYIDRQEEHHRTQSFQEEYLGLLRKHDVDFDERYLWDW